MTSIKLLHVSAQGCHHQGAYRTSEYIYPTRYSKYYYYYYYYYPFLYVVILLSELCHSDNTNKLLYFIHCMLGYKFCVRHPPIHPNRMLVSVLDFDFKKWALEMCTFLHCCYFLVRWNWNSNEYGLPVLWDVQDVSKWLERFQSGITALKTHAEVSFSHGTKQLHGGNGDSGTESVLGAEICEAWISCFSSAGISAKIQHWSPISQ